MDRHTALQILNELSRTTSADLSDEQLAAVELLADDPALDRAFRRQDALDERLAELMPAVDVPSGLQERLLAAVAEQSGSVAEAVVQPAASRTRLSRRRAASLLAAACGLFAVAVWCSWPGTAPLAMADLQQSVPQVWDADLPAFDGGFETPLPQGPWGAPQIAFDDGVWGLARPGAGWLGGGGDVAAVRRFQFAMRNRAPVSGLLLTLEADSFDPQQTPAAGSFLSGNVSYARLGDGSEVALVPWREGDLVYVAVVPKGEPHRAFEQLLTVQPI